MEQGHSVIVCTVQRDINYLFGQLQVTLLERGAITTNEISNVIFERTKKLFGR